MSRDDRIKTEINDDPLTRGYLGMDDAAVAVSFNVVNRTGVISRQELFSELATDDSFGDVYELSLGSSSAPGYHQAAQLMFMLNDVENSSLDIRSTPLNTIFSGLTSASVISVQKENNILRLNDNKRSRGDELKVGTVRTGDITVARR